MYKRILVAIDATPTAENQSALDRTEQIGRDGCDRVHPAHGAEPHRPG